jgi:hypothetical protein
VSLRVVPDGLKTAAMDLPNGEKLWLHMDLRNHKVRLQTSYGGTQAISMRDGATGTEFGDQVLAAVALLGLEGSYAREKFENDDIRTYDPAEAERFLSVLVEVNRIFNDHRATLNGMMGPVKLWSHGFDLAMEWFGTRLVTDGGDGEAGQHPAQLNLGFYPGAPTYFYSNPWPFEGDKLLEHDLPTGARWHTEGWQGTLLPYAELVGDDSGEARLREFAQRVHELTAPTLMA